MSEKQQRANFTSVLSNVGINGFPIKEGVRVSYDHGLLFQVICNHLHRNPNSTLMDLSRGLRVGRRTIQTTIRITSAKTFRQLREEVLIARLNKFFLSNPTLAIKELSFELGYTCPQSFARAVKRACGMSPERLRSSVIERVLVH